MQPQINRAGHPDPGCASSPGAAALTPHTSHRRRGWHRVRDYQRHRGVGGEEGSRRTSAARTQGRGCRRGARRGCRRALHQIAAARLRHGRVARPGQREAGHSVRGGGGGGPRGGGRGPGPGAQGTTEAPGAPEAEDTGIAPWSEREAGWWERLARPVRPKPKLWRRPPGGGDAGPPCQGWQGAGGGAAPHRHQPLRRAVLGYSINTPPHAPHHGRTRPMLLIACWPGVAVGGCGCGAAATTTTVCMQRAQITPD
jgi:hypothetical protein